MTRFDLLQGLWALSPDALTGVARALAGTIGAPHTFADLPRAEALSYTVRDGGVAVFTIEGLVLPKPSPFAALRCSARSRPTKLPQWRAPSAPTRA